MYVWTVEAVIFPLDVQWGINRSAYSPGLSKQMVWLSAILPYEQCQAVFEQVNERLIPAKSIQRQTAYYGTKMQAQVEAHQEGVSVERVVLPDVRYDHEQRKGVSLDGGWLIFVTKVGAS